MVVFKNLNDPNPVPNPSLEYRIPTPEKPWAARACPMVLDTPDKHPAEEVEKKTRSPRADGIHWWMKSEFIGGGTAVIFSKYR